MATEPEPSSPENPISLPTDSSPEKPIFSPPSDFFSHSTETLDQPPTPWIDHAIAQARVYQTNIEETLNSALEASRSRLSQFRATGSSHLSQTIDSFEDVMSSYVDYENTVLSKVREAASVVASNPLITAGVATALGLVVFKGPRRFLYYKSLRLFMSEESLLTRAHIDSKELQHAINGLKAESKQLESRAANAEKEFINGRKKLRYAGQQIQSAIGTCYKIERQARGLNDIIRELPRREASLFRDRVKNLANEAKQERKILSKEVRKISNYGISV